MGGADSDGIRIVKSPKPEGGVTMAKEEMATKQGVPLYPGSDAPSGQSTVTSGVTESSYNLVLETSDPVKKVVDFYKSKVPGLNGGANAGGSEFRGLTPNKTPVHITISGKDGKTRISVVAIVETPAKKD